MFARLCENSLVHTKVTQRGPDQINNRVRVTVDGVIETAGEKACVTTLSATAAPPCR